MTADTTGIGSAGNTGNSANFNGAADWNGQDGNVTTVGSNGGASAYGAFDMGGNVWEWNDLTGAADSFRGVRGGVWNSFGAFGLSSSERSPSEDPSNEFIGFGFRLAAVPEPSTCVMAGVGIACAGWGEWRRRRAG